MKKDRRAETGWPAPNESTKPHMKRSQKAVSPKEDRRRESIVPLNATLEEILAPGWAWRILNRG